MGLPKVVTTLSQGGTGRPLPGFDHYSALIAHYYAGSANVAYAAIGDKIYTSLKDAETDGVVNTCVEATAATTTDTITNVGANGDTISYAFTSYDGTVIQLGSYTKVNSDNTATLVATAAVAAINGNTYLTGFSASVGAAGAYTVTAPKKLGIYPNTLSMAVTIVGTIANTNVAFASGTRSNLAMFHYQISEVFRKNPLCVLYFSIKLDNSGNNAAAYNTQLKADGLAVLNAFKGNARQTLIYNPFRTFATSTTDALKTLYTTLFNQYTPCIFGYVGGFTGALSAQANLRALTDDNVSTIIGQSITGEGFEKSKTQYSVICAGGAWLGTQSLVAVSNSIGQPIPTLNISDGTECEGAGFFDGSDFNTIIGSSLADLLNDYGYTFLIKFAGGFVGTYWNGGPCAITPASDYAYTEDCRTVNKAVRNIYLSILPQLNVKNITNSDGTLSIASIAAYNEKVDAALDSMVRDQDLSGFSRVVSTTEIVASTGKVPIAIKLLKAPIGREIDILIGFAAKL